MQWLEPLTDWARANSTVLWWSFAGALAFFLLTPPAVAWTLIHLPADYFKKSHHRPLGSWDAQPTLRIVLLILKNLAGAVLVIAGLAMLLAPGQGLLTLAAGILLLDFPGKFRLERWMMRRRSVLRTINWLRRKAGRDPLKRPPKHD